MLLEKLKKISFLRKIYDFPGIASLYHFLLAFLGALIYGFPSRKLIVIGVTGTKGKTTTCNLIKQILKGAGRKTGMITTVNMSDGEKEWINDLKQTMPGRFMLQKLLSQMVKNGCKYAVIETSSEGILQHRHGFLDYKIAVFTNLSPEHIERHSSFEKYRETKIKLFKKAAKKSGGVGVYNLDDENIDYFLAPHISLQYGYAIKDSHTIKNNKNNIPPNPRFSKLKRFNIADIVLGRGKTSFTFNGEKLEMPLIGEFNVYNAAAAICVALSFKIPIQKIKEVLSRAKPALGRLEIVDKGQNFTVVVDYAHEPVSLEAVYKTITNLHLSSTNNTNIREISGHIRKYSRKGKLICLLGSQGGGRDKWKRVAMGKIAAEYCDYIVLTNEDPYDEPPEEILNDIEKGVLEASPDMAKGIYKIIDRREAIKKAISLARKGDVVILTGKGGEVWMCAEGGKKIPWEEKKIVEEVLSENKK